MDWSEEQAKIELVINSRISWCEEEMCFWEELEDLVGKASARSSFLKKARVAAEELTNPLLCDELVQALDFVFEEEL